MINELSMMLVIFEYNYINFKLNFTNCDNQFMEV